MASDLLIRKALEAPLKAAIIAQYGVHAADPTRPECLVAWPGMTFDPNKLVGPIYCRPTLQIVTETPRTLGQTPDVSTTGAFKIGCFIKSGQREDPLTILVDTVKSAYSYADDLSAGGARIQIDGRSSGNPIDYAGWLSRSVDISWRINI